MAEEAAVHLQRALDALGFAGDPEMRHTASRLATFLADWAPSAEPPELSICATPMRSQAVAVRGIGFHALCAHHLLPFFGSVTVAYRAGERLAGFGAIPRVVRWAAGRPQLQERMARAIADRLVQALEPEAVLVRIVARHLCVEMRGSRGMAEMVVEHPVGDVRGLRELLG